MVQRTSARGISQQGRSATGVRVMNVREDDLVRAIALVVESEPDGELEELGIDPGAVPGGNGDVPLVEGAAVEEPMADGGNGVADADLGADDGDEQDEPES
jgi:DNA gyrase subunit A